MMTWSVLKGKEERECWKREGEWLEHGKSGRASKGKEGRLRGVPKTIVQSEPKEEGKGLARARK